MSSKITNFFKIKPKSSKIGEEEAIPPKTRECQVILKDIKHQFSNNELKLFEEISLNTKNCKKGKNICKFCEKKCNSESNLNQHMKNIHPTEFDLINCEMCNRRFFGKQRMEIHMKKKHPDGQINQFECDFDGKIYKTKIKPKSLKVEEDEAIPPKIRECQVILKDIKQQFGSNELKLFEEISLNERISCKLEKYSCKYCGKSLSSKNCLKTHMKNVHSTKFTLFNCALCNRRFFKKNSVETHMKKKHPDGQIDQFECDFDGKIFKTKNKLYTYMGCHLSLVECQICHKMLKFRSIHSHMTNFHVFENQFQCKICDKQFKSKRYLSAHEKLHNKQFKCEICNKMFSINSHLDDHKKNYHNNPGSFECEICGKKFCQKSNLKSHQKTHNKNRQKPLQCQRCDYATDDKRSFKFHLKFHEKQDKKFASMKNPLKCGQCPKFYKNKIALHEHMRIVHPKELFQCDLCAKFIKRKAYLISHIDYHIRKN
ncbi:zinc finger protein 43-like [Chironomus tepperi]|uniref:zinc finger protein 43-like n=1 Tax=Chironomus tepperi TaxID=113505 RepID=UPI00391F526A